MKSIYIWTLVAVLSMAGCTSYHAKVGDAEINMVYFLQDKNVKSFTFDPNSGTVTIENFGSETSQIIGEAIRAVLGGL